MFTVFFQFENINLCMCLCSFYISVDKYHEICKEQKDWWTTRIKQINTWLEHKPKKN